MTGDVLVALIHPLRRRCRLCEGGAAATPVDGDFHRWRLLTVLVSGRVHILGANEREIVGSALGTFWFGMARHANSSRWCNESVVHEVNIQIETSRQPRFLISDERPKTGLLPRLRGWDAGRQSYRSAGSFAR